MMLVWRTQVSMMERVPCEFPFCPTTGAYVYESAANSDKVTVCVQHDLLARNEATINGDVIMDVAYKQEV